MSYSFQIRGATKALALAAVTAELAKVVESQPIHAHDQAAAYATAESFAAQLPESETHDVAISVNGYLQWEGPQSDPLFVGTSVTVSARLLPKA